MSVQTKVPRSSLPRHLRDVAENARRAAQSAVSKAANPTQEERIQNAVLRESKKRIGHEHGSRIYVWHHLLKDHVVYSLNKTMKNNAALRQLPFNGKKTVPRALRKDHWSPLAMVQFPTGHSSIGLTCFRKLREYRRRHELEWGDEIRYWPQTEQQILDKKPRQLVNFKERGRKICDQKANSVADLAAVLGELGGEKPRVRTERKRGYVSAMSKKEEALLDQVGEVGEEGQRQMRPIVYWRSIEDAEFAPEWSDLVEHEELRTLGKDRLVKSQFLIPEEVEETSEIDKKTEGEEKGTKPRTECKAEDETPLSTKTKAGTPSAEGVPKEAPALKPKSFLGKIFSSLK